jgi:CheY-like chemotaxis protein
MFDPRKAFDAMMENRPLVWIYDSERGPLADCPDLFEDWADALYLQYPAPLPEDGETPDAILVSAEIPGGAAGEVFVGLCDAAGSLPVLVLAKLRSLTQALAFFRAGAADYLPLPMEEEELQERLAAALARAERLAMQSVMVELEPVDSDTGEISLNIVSADQDDGQEEVDILAGIVVPPPERETRKPPDDDGARAVADDAPTEHGADGEEPEAVDGLPIPTLWEELPCGLLVFDSRGNLVFSNSLGLELFGHDSLAELQDALENRLSGFAAHGANHKPLPDNQWPHVLARKSRAARSAVVSVERTDRRRAWLRIDCLPHLAEGKITRLSMTLVNLTGELPPLAPAAPAAGRAARPRSRGKRRK